MGSAGTPSSGLQKEEVPFAVVYGPFVRIIPGVSPAPAPPGGWTGFCVRGAMAAIRYCQQRQRIIK